jgi:hypothetical protein
MQERDNIWKKWDALATAVAVATAVIVLSVGLGAVILAILEYRKIVGDVDHWYEIMAYVGVLAGYLILVPFLAYYLLRVVKNSIYYVGPAVLFAGLACVLFVILWVVIAYTAGGMSSWFKWLISHG